MISFKDVTIKPTTQVSTYRTGNMTQVQFKGNHRKAVCTHFKGKRTWLVAYFDRLDAMKANYVHSDLSKADAWGNAVDYVEAL